METEGSEIETGTDNTDDTEDGGTGQKPRKVGSSWKTEKARERILA